MRGTIERTYLPGPCTDCGANGEVTAIVCGPGVTDNLRKLTCSTCKGERELSPERAAALTEGERIRRDRIERGLSQREEATRLGITPRELNAKEHP